MLKDIFDSAIGTLSSVRKTITIMLSLVFCYLAITDNIDSSHFKDVYLIVIGFYFARSTALDIPTNTKENK